MHRLCTIFILCLASFLGVRGQECKNEFGEPVDWFYLYKMPRLEQPLDFFLRKGLGYIYLTSKHPTADWRHAWKSMNDSQSIVGRVLAPLYNKTTSEKLLYILYNDDPPSLPSNTNYGHTKGVVVSDGEKGIWLVHSCPRFPPEPATEKKPNKTQSSGTEKIWNHYSYPDSATKYGQSFLCISLKGKELNDVGNLLMYNKPRIYSSNVPEGMKNNFPNLTRAANGEYVKKSPWHYKTRLTTPGGSKFTAFAKSKQFNKDLYASLIAPEIKSNLQVESWMNGPGDLPSECRGNYSVQNIARLGIRMEYNVTYLFKSSQDHSKWAVSDSNKSTICVGDINRMESQLKRGGGSVCFRHPQIWKRYKKAVMEVEPCPKRLFN